MPPTRPYHYSPNDPFAQLVEKLFDSANASASDINNAVATHHKAYLLILQHSLSLSIRQGHFSGISTASTKTSGAGATSKIISTSATRTQQHQSWQTQQHQSNPSAPDIDHALYQRAGLLTPTEQAERDWQGGRLWLAHITDLILRKAAAGDSSLQSLVVLCTTRSLDKTLPGWWNRKHNPTKRGRNMLSDTARTGNKILQTIDLYNDPFRWNEDPKGSDSSASTDNRVNLEDLQSIVTAVQERIRAIEEDRTGKGSVVAVAIDSLTPIVARHGMAKTLKLLHKLQTQNRNVLLVAPVLRESLTAQQHRQIEDMAQAVLILEGGQATLLRRGIRQSDNLVRQDIAFDITSADILGASVTSEGGGGGGGGGNRIEIELQEQDAINVEGGHSHSHDHASTSAAGSSEPSSTSRRPKVTLQLQDDDSTSLAKRTPTLSQEGATGQPRIIVQDDDPEFDDYDEEDPDDDLDI